MARTVKKVASKKATKTAAKKTPAKKASTKKAVAKKPAAKKIVKKTPAKKTTAKKAVKKAPAKKTAAKKAVTKKPSAKKTPAKAKKTTIKKTAAKPAKKALTKKATAPKKTATKKSVSKTTKKKPTSVKKTVSKTTAKKAPAKTAKTKAAKATASTSTKKATKKKVVNKEEVIKKLAGATKNTPAAFKVPSRKNTPIVFSMGDMQDLLKDTSNKSNEADAVVAAPAKKKTQIDNVEVTQKPRTLKSATLDDLLGLGGNTKAAVANRHANRDEKDVPRKWISYYRSLVEIRERLALSVGERSEQAKASAKESAGDLSSYGQHIGDAGTDAYEYDFTVNMVSSEQGMLKEVDAAIDRIFDGTYGVCEVTGKPIKRERLQAVPFTRFSKEGQDQFEKTKRRTVQRIGIASDDNEDGFGSYAADDTED